ncbi:MAG: GcrA family cell cycle regulator [Negativicutes bacterium]|nr:GcrA family cell cycle regulator [Negativicutes bacterium]
MGWTQTEEALLSRLYEAKTPASIMAEKLGRNPGAVHAKASRMRLTAKAPNYYVPQRYVWNDDDIAQLRELFSQGQTVSEIAQKLGRAKSAIYRKLDKLNLHRCKSRQDSMHMDFHQRDPLETRRFTRLLRVLVWCKAKTGHPSSLIVSAVLNDGERRKYQLTNKV